MMLRFKFQHLIWKVQSPEVASGTRQPTLHVCLLTCFYCWLSDRTLPFQIRFFCFAGGPGGRALDADWRKCKSPFTFFVQVHQFFMIFFITDHWYSTTRQVCMHLVLMTQPPDIIPSEPQSPWLYPERYASHWEIWDFQNSPRILDGSSGLCSNENQHHLALCFNILWPPTSAKNLTLISATATGPTSRIFCQQRSTRHQTRYDNKRKCREEFNEGVNMPSINLYPTSPNHIPSTAPTSPYQGSMVVLVSRRISVWSEIHEIGISLGAIDSAHLYT